MHMIEKHWGKLLTAATTAWLVHRTGIHSDAGFWYLALQAMAGIFSAFAVFQVRMIAKGVRKVLA